MSNWGCHFCSSGVQAARITTDDMSYCSRMPFEGQSIMSFELIILVMLFLTAMLALFQVRLDSVLVKFQTLQHFFFVLRKLFEGDLSAQDLPESSSDHLSIISFSSQGGFLRLPVFDSPPVNVNLHSSNVDLKSREKFIRLLSETSWPSIQRCLMEGKAFIDSSFCQVFSDIFILVSDQTVVIIQSGAFSIWPCVSSVCVCSCVHVCG